MRYLNPAAQTLLELDGQQCLGMPLADILPCAHEFTPVLQRVLDTRETVTRRELALTIGAQDTRHSVTVDCTVSILSEKEGSVELLVELVPLDRHLRISREAALASQSHTNRAFARKLAHEIKNPLGGLRGAAQLLARHLEDAKLLEYTRIIVMEADRLAALVDTLLGPVETPHRVEVNLHELVEHVLRLTEAVFQSKLRITRDYDPSLPEVRVDRDQIIQALLNIAKNAREAAGAHGAITFRTRALRQFTVHGTRHRLVACVEVADDGPGIPPELLPRLFLPLVSSKTNGAGLGLSIAQELVTRHDGLIECVSAPGHTVFSILLPIGTHYERATP